MAVSLGTNTTAFPGEQNPFAKRRKKESPFGAQFDLDLAGARAGIEADPSRGAYFNRITRQLITRSPGQGVPAGFESYALPDEEDDRGPIVNPPGAIRGLLEAANVRDIEDIINALPRPPAEDIGTKIPTAGKPGAIRRLFTAQNVAEAGIDDPWEETYLRLMLQGESPVPALVEQMQSLVQRFKFTPRPAELDSVPTNEAEVIAMGGGTVGGAAPALIDPLWNWDGTKAVKGTGWLKREELYLAQLKQERLDFSQQADLILGEQFKAAARAVGKADATLQEDARARREAANIELQEAGATARSAAQITSAEKMAKAAIDAQYGEFVEQHGLEREKLGYEKVRDVAERASAEKMAANALTARGAEFEKQYGLEQARLAYEKERDAAALAEERGQFGKRHGLEQAKLAYEKEYNAATLAERQRQFDRQHELEQSQFGQQLGLEQARLAYEKERGAAELAVQQGQFSRQHELAQTRLEYEKARAGAELAVQQGQFDRQYQLELTRLGEERGRNEANIASAEKMVRATLDAQRSQFDKQYDLEQTRFGYEKERDDSDRELSRAIHDGNLNEAVRQNRAVEALNEKIAKTQEEQGRMAFLGTMLQNGGLMFFTLAQMDAGAAQGLFQQLTGAQASDTTGPFAAARRFGEKFGSPGSYRTPSVQELAQQTPLEAMQTRAAFEGQGRDVFAEAQQLAPQSVVARRRRAR